MIQDAAGLVREKATIVATMATQSTTIPPRAAAGLRRPKNSTDQATLRINCAEKRPSAPPGALNPALRHTIQAATAIRRYSVDHAGAKIQFGGFHVGLRRSAYQLSSAGVVNHDPTAPAPKQTRMKATRTSQSPRMDARFIGALLPCALPESPCRSPARARHLVDVTLPSPGTPGLTG